MDGNRLDQDPGLTEIESDFSRIRIDLDLSSTIINRFSIREISQLKSFIRIVCF